MTNKLLPRICEDAVLGLQVSFTEAEVTNSVFSMDGNKYPGLGGFPMSFYQIFWDVIKQDVLAVVNEFEDNPLSIKLFNATQLVLIPKMEGAG